MLCNWCATCDSPKLGAASRSSGRPTGWQGWRRDVKGAALVQLILLVAQGGLTFPTPRRAWRSEHIVSPPAGTVAKAALFVAMTEAGVSKVQLTKRLGVDEKAVRRLLDPNHGSKLPRIVEAIEALGRRLDIGLEAT